MTTVHNPAPLSTSAHRTPAPSPPLVSTPKRERNPQTENMLHDFHSFQSLSHPHPAHSSFQPHIPLPHSTSHYPYAPHHQQPHPHQPHILHQHSHHSHTQPHNQPHQSDHHQQPQYPHQHHQPSQQQPQQPQQQPQPPPQQDQQQHSQPQHSQPQQQHQLQQPHQSQHPQPLHQRQGQQSQHLQHAHVPLPLNQPHTSPDHQQQPHSVSQALSHQQLHAQPLQQSQQSAQPHTTAHLQSQTQQPQAHAKTNSQTHQPQQQPLQPPSLPQLHHQPPPVPPSTSQHQTQQPPHLQPPPPPQHSTQSQHQQSHQQQPTQQQPLQPLLQQQQHHQSVLLPALSHGHFKHTDEVDVADDLINFASLPTSRPQDMQAALVSSAFSHDHLPHGQVQSVMDAFLPEPEQDPLNMNVTIHMPIHMDPQRSIERQVLVASDADTSVRPSVTAQHGILNTHTSSALQSAQQPFSLQVPPSITHLSYGGQANAIPHPQVLLQGPSSVSPFHLPVASRPSIDTPSQLMLGRNMGRVTQQGILQLSQTDEAQRRGMGSNQISIQDLTKPKTEHIENPGHDAQFSPASPSFSAVTISPHSLVQPPQQPAITLGSSAANVTASGGESPTSVAASQGLSCPLCNSVFTRRYNLKVHMSSKHSARRDYHCQDCPNAFNRVDSLKRHVATTHRGEKKWMCTYCQRTFGQRPHMKMHIDTVHLKKRDHKCHCGKAFGTRYNLTAHQRTHQQTPKKHVCSVCKKSFALKSSLARHQRNSAHSNPELSPVPRMQN